MLQKCKQIKKLIIFSRNGKICSIYYEKVLIWLHLTFRTIGLKINTTPIYLNIIDVKYLTYEKMIKMNKKFKI